ncbi:electron transfer flavoprotein subunit beta/FixA family protein [bacterium]|nr:electron transfer flavoprotein subunit beta/FixA family protein [bacterium]
MNIFVLVKQVPDTETKIRVNASSSGIEAKEIAKWIVNPYDEHAIEEALKTKEKLKEGTVTAIAVGPDRVVEALRTALAMGCDNAIHIKADESIDTYVAAKALAAACKKESPQLIFAGKQAIDDDQAATFGYVAEYLDIPSVSVVVKVDVATDKKSLRAVREVEGGTHTVETSLPALIAVNQGINNPRYASLPGIMKAKKKEIKAHTLADLGLGSETALTKDSAFALPPPRKACVILQGEVPAQVKELVKRLREEAKVI